MSAELPFELWSKILSLIQDPCDWIRIGCVSTDFRRIIQFRHWSLVHTVGFRKGMYQMEIVLFMGQFRKDETMFALDEDKRLG